MRNFVELAGANGQRPNVNALSVACIVQSLGKHVATWLRTCADYYAAAMLYEQLSGLSDAELHRRGLTRENLGRDVCAACDHAH
jgi:hypothetical protein